MPKLRKTLPKDFKEIVASGDAEEIKAALMKCQPDAYEDNAGKKSALMCADLPEEVIRWLVEEYGADVNYADVYGHTPLSEAAVRRPEKIDLLLSLGADINFQKDRYPTALIFAAMAYCPHGVRKLVESGADIHRTDGYSGFNALDEALIRCQNVDIPAMALIAGILLDAGMEVTEGRKRLVTQIGKNFEFYRGGFSSDYLPACDAGLSELYRLFGVPPVPHLKKYDGGEPISVKGRTWTQQYNELWDMLVPGSGKAAFVQGEAIRIIGRLSHEILDNGAMNWDGDFRAMRDSLAALLSEGSPADEKIIRQIRKISPDTDENTFNAIAKAVVAWILANPVPKALGDVSYSR